MKEQELRYVSIYWDSKEIDGEWTLVPYLRLIPGWLDLEEAGFPHGLSLGWKGQRTEEEILAWAKIVDDFIEKFVQSEIQNAFDVAFNDKPVYY